MSLSAIGNEACTMILELDAGNTRIKWRLRDKQATSNAWSTVTDGSVYALERTPSVFIELGKQLEKLPMKNINRTLVSSVRAEGFRIAFSSIMSEKWHLQPEFAVSGKQYNGVVNAYSEPGRLGVDRWLAMLAAHHRTPVACCVIDCGTTITVDLIAANGQHQGGYIVPGLQLLKESLAVRSKALATEKTDWSSSEPGTSTIAAVHNGILRSVLGFIRDIKRESDNSGIRYQWYLTGGDAAVLLPYLDWEIQHQPDLVLDGLELAMLSPARLK